MPDFEDLPPPDGSDHQIYKGDNDHCDQCGRKFLWGDLILVEQKTGSHTFCLSDFEVLSVDEDEKMGMPCMAQWTAQTGKIVLAKVMKFGGD